MIKQLRVSRFMGSVFLSDNQRELIKFLKHYLLYTQKRKKGKRNLPRKESVRSRISTDGEETVMNQENMEVHPADEAMLDFKPDDDDIDCLLYNGIVETEENVDFNSQYQYT